MVVEKIKEHILSYENLQNLVSLVNEEMDTSASEYRYRLDIISAEMDNVSYARCVLK